MPRAIHHRLFFFAAAFLQSTDNQLVPPLLPKLLAGGGDAGNLLVAYALGAAFPPLMIAARVPASHAPRLVRWALAILGLAAVGFAATESMPLRLGARALAGAASGVLSFALLVVASDEPNDHERSCRITALTAGFLCALVVGVPGGAWLADSQPVALVWMVVAAGAAAACFAAGPVLRSSATHAREAHAVPSSVRELLASLRQPAVTRLLTATVLVGASVAMPMARLGLFLKGSFDASSATIGSVYLMAGLAPLLAMPVAPRVIARLGTLRVTMVGCLALAAALVVFPAGATSVTAAGLILLVALFFETLRRAALQDRMATAVGTLDRARFLAIRGVLVQVGLAAGFAAAGPLDHRFGFTAVCLVGAGLSVGAAFTLAIGGTAPASA